MTRKEAREFMMKVFFQMEASKDFNVDNKKAYMRKDDNIGQSKEYCEELFSLLCNKRDEIDGAIEEFSRNWSVSRMPKTDLAVLRLAVCEILYIDDSEVPDPVAINEAVELAKVYGETDSYSYVNGILGNIAKKKNEN